MITGLQIAKNGFWYDHGVELLSAVVTLVAFIFTFWNITRTNKKMNSDEIKKNEKTLKMIDLVTQKQRESLEKYLKHLKNSKEIEKKDCYTIVFEKYNFALSVNNELAVIICRTSNYLYQDNVDTSLNSYIDKLKEMLVNNHTNLNLGSLEIINNKLNDLDNTITQINTINMNLVHEMVFSESRKPLEEQTKIQEKYNEFKELDELIENACKQLCT